MKYYHVQKSFNKLGEWEINYINNLLKNRPNSNVLIEIPNTRGISSNLLRKLDASIYVRVAGAYDKERVEKRKSWKFKNGETGEYYTDSVIYSRNESLKILEEMEKIEKGIHPEWADWQKAYYCYDKLRSAIIYDSKFESQPSYETRTLRGLVSKKSVCAGYALIYKELMDRQGISCEYVEGYTKKDKDGNLRDGHAWNILTLDGKKYPIDLTWDANVHQRGDSKTVTHFGQNLGEFIRKHIPCNDEKTQDYAKVLHTFDPNLINGFKQKISREKSYGSSMYVIQRDDGTTLKIAQIGTAKRNGKDYYRYYYNGEDLLSGGKMGPAILYSELNIQGLKYERDFNKKADLVAIIRNISTVFSQNNIRDSLSRGTGYVGALVKDPVMQIPFLDKDTEAHRFLKYPTKTFRRSDGSTFIVQQMVNAPVKVGNTPIFQYDIVEAVNENGKAVVKKNSVYTEQDILRDARPQIADSFLSRSRLDRKMYEAGGYIGFLDNNGCRRYNPELVNRFSIGTVPLGRVKQQTSLQDLAQQKRELTNIRDEMKLKYEKSKSISRGNGDYEKK